MASANELMHADFVHKHCNTSDKFCRMQTATADQITQITIIAIVYHFAIWTPHKHTENSGTENNKSAQKEKKTCNKPTSNELIAIHCAT